MALYLINKSVCSLVVIFLSLSVSSKLNVPRVLLPLFKDFTTNFTLEVKESGCYKWSTLRPNIIDLKQLFVDPELGCSSEVIISPKTKEFHRNSETVLAEDVHSGQVLRCEVIVDVIHSLNLFTTTRELFLEESPESFEVQAYDDQGNAFSTLVGVEFDWTFKTVGLDGSSSNSSEYQVVRHIPFHVSPYETPPSVALFDRLGLKGHIILLEGAQTGICTVTVGLPYQEYKNVPQVSVQLMVLTNLIINPAEVSILLGDEINYRLFQVQHGKVNEIFFPSKQYYLQSEKPKCVKVDPTTGYATGLNYCKTKVVLVDRNVVSSIGSDVKPPTATISVSHAEQIALAILPSRKWAATVGQSCEIIVEIYDKENRKMYIGERVEVKSFIDEHYFRVEEASGNGTYIYGTPVKPGQAKVSATLLGVVDSRGAMQKSEHYFAEAVLHIYNPIEVVPPAVLLPWDPVTKGKYEISLSVTGGDGHFLWTSSNNSIAVVTQSGVVKSLDSGNAIISAVMSQNHYNKGTSELFVTKPVRIEILDYVMEAPIGSPLQLFIVLYGTVRGVEMPFTLCDALTFEVGLSDDNFDYMPGNSSYRVGPSCASITLVGRSPGATRISINYKNLEASAVIATFKKLEVFNPRSGLTILAVGTSRNIAFIGGPRPWAIRPSEHSHFVYNAGTKIESWEEILEVEELIDNSQSQHRDFYAYHVTCLKLGEIKITLQVMNKIPASNSKATEETVNVTVICGKPRYLVLASVMKKADASKCPMHLSSERLISQNYKDIELDIMVNDIQGRKFDNISSLQIEWQLSHSSLAKILDPNVLKSSTITEEGVKFPDRFYQIIKPKGKTGVLDVKARIVGYNKNSNPDIIFECPAFPEKNRRGRLETPDIRVNLNVILVNDTMVTRNVTEIYNHENSVETLKIAQGSGFYDFVLNNQGIVNLKYSEETRLIELRPVTVGKVTITLLDLCLDAKPASISVKVYTIGSVKLDVVEKVEKGKSITATVSLYDENNVKLNCVPQIDLVHLVALAESNIIKVKPYEDATCTGGEVKYLVSGLELGNTYLKFSAGCCGEEVYSRSSPIQVFPGLRASPKNVTMLVGSTLQISTFDGPSDGFVEFFIEKTSLAKVDCDGVVEALKIGKTMLVARSLSTHKENGEKMVDSEDVVEINIVPLKGVSIQSPITRIVEGAVMPLWAVGVPDELDSLRLGSTKYELLFYWENSNEHYGQVKTIFEDMGIQVPESDQVTMRFKALKPGRVIISLTLEVPPQISGTNFKQVFTDSLIIEIYPLFSLIKPVQMPVNNLLVSTNAEFDFVTNRDGIGLGKLHYRVSALPGQHGNSGSDLSDRVIWVGEHGQAKTYSSYGSAAVTFMIAEDFGLKTWHSIAVNVKPIHYIMLNVNSKLKIKANEVVRVLPTGLDIDFFVSFHDNFGNEFHAVRSNILLESNRKGCLNFGRGETNSSLIVSFVNSGYSMMKVWDDKVPHKPADYVKIHTGKVLFPISRHVTVGDVICFRMSLTCGEDPVTAWHIEDPTMIHFSDETAIGVALNKFGPVQISYQSKKKLTTTLEILPIKSIEFLPTNTILSTVLDTEYFISLILKSSLDTVDKTNNLISYNGTCNAGWETFKVPSYPYNCDIKFNNPIPPMDIRQIYSVSPHFDMKSGLYLCKLKVICSANKKISTLSESVVVHAFIPDPEEEVRASPLILNFLPGVFPQQSELKVSQTKPNDKLVVTGIKDTLLDLKVVPSYKNLITVNCESEKSTSKNFFVEVDESWWTMEDPPPLSLTVWSEVTNQKIKIPIKCIGPHIAGTNEQASKWLQWTIGFFVLFVSSLVIYCNYFRPLRPVQNYHPTENYFAMPFSQSVMYGQHGSPTSFTQTPEDQMFVRPFGESPVYGSPQRHRPAPHRTSYT